MEYYTETQIYLEAINKWGTQSQIEMLVEECAELIVALKHDQRDIKGHDSMKIITELVDVQIMLNQVKLMYPESCYNTEYKRKMKRLEEMVLK